MARQFMTKEVTKTTVNAGILTVDENGESSIKELKNIYLVGNVSKEVAQKKLSKEHGTPVTVFKIDTDTQKYRMEVAKFIELADLVIEDVEQSESAE